MATKIKKIRSLFELSGTPELQKLAIVTAENLGYPGVPTFKQAMGWLHDNAMEAGDEGDKMIVDEVNFCRDLV